MRVIRQRWLLLSSFLVASAASAQVRLPVQGYLTDSGVAVEGEQTLEFRLLDDSAAELSCESRELTLDRGYFTVMLGDADAIDCGGDESAVLVPELFASPLSLEVSLDGTVLGLFPIGDAPSAGFAHVASRLVGERPSVLRVAEASHLAAALSAAATVATETSPVVIELGPGEYDVGDATLEIPPYTSLRGKGPGVTRLRSTAALVLRGENRLEALTVGEVRLKRPENWPTDRPDTYELERVHVVVANRPNALVMEPVEEGQGAAGGPVTVLTLRGSRISANQALVAVSVAPGGHLSVMNSEIDIRGATNLAVAIRGNANSSRIEVYDSVIVASATVGGSGSFAGAVEIFLAGAGAEVEIVSSRLHARGALESRLINANNADVKVRGSLLEGNQIVYLEEQGRFRLSHSTIRRLPGDPFRFSAPDLTAPVACASVIDEETFALFSSDCALTP